MKKGLIFIGVLVLICLAVNNIYAQESVIEYKQLIAKCSEAIKQAKSYNVKMEYNSSFTINSKENKGNFAELHIAFISPDRFKVEQIINEGSEENLWDGWILIGNDYYVLNPVSGWDWVKEGDDNRKVTCKNNSPEGIINQFEIAEKEYKRDSISPVAKDGIEYFVIKYSFGKESIDMESLPPELRDSKINGTHEIWINKNNYLPLKQSSEVSYYSNEQNKGTVSTNINYSSYDDAKIRIDAPSLGDKVF